MVWFPMFALVFHGADIWAVARAFGATAPVWALAELRTGWAERLLGLYSTDWSV